MKITLIVSSFLFSFPIPFSPNTRIFVDSCVPSKHVEKNSTKPRYKWIALSENPRECHLSYTLSKPFNVPSMKQTAMKRINPQGNLVELNTVPSFSADNTTRVAWIKTTRVVHVSKIVITRLARLSLDPRGQEWPSK